MSVIVTVAALTAPLNVVPPDCVIVKVPMSVPTAPAVTAPKVLRVRLLANPAAVPVIDPRVMILLIPVPTVRVTLSTRVAFPIVIAPVDVPPTSDVPPTFTPVVPRLITPVPAAVIVPLMVLLEGAVATTPPVNPIVSPPSPSVTVPVFPKVVAPAIVFAAPVIDTL